MGKTTCFLVDGKFINTDRDITNMWFDRFETLGQPTIDNSYNESFRIKVELAVEQIFAECVSTLSCTEPLLVYDNVKEVCHSVKYGVAEGPDMTTYEHLEYRGPVLWDTLSKLYFSLFVSCDVPSQSRTFLFFLYSRGKVLKHGTGRAIIVLPCFQFFCKVFEMILLRQLEKIAKKRFFLPVTVWI